MGNSTKIKGLYKVDQHPLMYFNFNVNEDFSSRRGNTSYYISRRGNTSYYISTRTMSFFRQHWRDNATALNMSFERYMHHNGDMFVTACYSVFNRDPLLFLKGGDNPRVEVFDINLTNDPTIPTDLQRTLSRVRFPYPDLRHVFILHGNFSDNRLALYNISVILMHMNEVAPNMELFSSLACYESPRAYGLEIWKQGCED